MAEFIIERTPVVSSNLASIGYDAARRIFAVEFKNGAVWHYAGVEAETWTDLNRAESKGRYFVTHIKGRYEAMKMTGPCPNCGAFGMVGSTCDDCGTAHYERETKGEQPAAGDA